MRTLQLQLKRTLKRTRSFFVVLFTFLIIFTPIFQSTLTYAAFNKQINYQGKLTTSAGVAVTNGDYNIEFKLMTVASGGDTTQGSCTTSCVWMETRTGANKVTVTSGLFSVLLGEVTSLSSVDFNQTLYLMINIGGTGSPSWDGVMTPRKKLGAVPAAVTAENVGGYIPSLSSTSNQIPVVDTGALVLSHATLAGLKATSSNPLTFNAGVTGDVQFFSSSNKITSAGALTLAGAITSGSAGTTGGITFNRSSDGSSMGSISAGSAYLNIIHTSGTTIGSSGNGVFFTTNGTWMGKSAISNVTPTALVHIPAGTATASTAPLKFTAGTNLTAAEAGAMEWDGTNLFITQTTGPTRKTLAYTSDLTSGYIPYTGGTSNVDLGIHNLTVDTNSLFVDATNHRVGVGTVSPQTPFHIVDNNQSGFRLERTTATARKWDTYVVNNGSYSIYDSTSGGDRLTINTSGSVGVGTNNPFNGASVTSGMELGTFNGTNADGNLIVRGYGALGGISKSGYGAVGSNYYLSSANALLAKNTDSVSLIEFSAGGFIFKNAGSTTANTAISLTELWRMTSSGNFITGTDNTYDIGASGATRPRTGYFGTSVLISTGSSMTSTVVSAGSASVSGDFLGYNSGSNKLYLGGAGAIAVTSGGSFAIGSSATNVFSGDISLNRASANNFAIKDNSTTTYWTIGSGGIQAGTDNTYDIGASSTTRPRTGYFGTSIIAPSAYFTPPVTTGTGATAGVQILANSLTTGNGLDVSSSSITSGNLVSFSSITSSTAASNTQTVLNVATSGSNPINQTTYGGYFSNTHTGTNSVNTALYATASGGSTNLAANFGATLLMSATAPCISLQLGTCSSSDNYIGRSGTAVTIQGSGQTSLAVGGTSYIDALSSTLRLGPSNSANVLINSTTNNGHKLDVILNSTASTISRRAISGANSATFDTTAGALSSYGGYFSSTSTRSAGANDLNNIGLYTTASGAQNNYAIEMVTAALTQTTAVTTNINGLNLSTAGALVQNTAAGTINWTGANIVMPNITQTTGTVTSTGLKITGGTVTSGTSYAFTSDANAGNVGIGTNTPGGTLSIVSANTTGTTTSSSLNLSTNSLTTGTGLYAASSTISSGKVIDVQVNSTATSSTGQTGVNILLTGANGTASQTTYGLRVSNTHTGTTPINWSAYFDERVNVGAANQDANHALIVRSVDNTANHGLKVTAANQTASMEFGYGTISTTGGMTLSPGTTTGLQISGTGGRMYVGGAVAPTALIHIAAGTTAASSAPLKFTSGTNMTAAEAGAMEWDGTNLFITQTTGPTRKTLAYTSDLTGGYIPYTGGTSNVDLGIHNLTVDTNSLFVDATNHRVGVGTITPGSKLDITTNSLGTTQTATSGLALINTTAAAVGAQQISPAIRWTGQGWKTDATAASQTVDFRAYILPVQGTSVPTSTWKLQAQRNGAGYSDVLSITDNGITTFTNEVTLTRFTMNGSYGTSGYVLKSNGSGNAQTWVDVNTLVTPFTLTNGSGTTANGTAVDLGGTLASSPVIELSGNTFDFTTGGKSLFRADPGWLVEMGDFAGNSNNTYLSVNDSTQMITAIAGNRDGIFADATNHTVRIGDAIGNGNGYYIFIDDTNSTIGLKSTSSAFGVTTGASIGPDANNSYTLGDSGHYFSETWSTTFRGFGLYLGSTGVGGGAITMYGGVSGSVIIQPQANAGTYNFNIPTTAGTSGYVLTSGGGGATAMTWTDPAALGVRWNALTVPNGNLSLAHGANTTAFTFNSVSTGTAFAMSSTSLSSGTILDLSSNGTAALTNQKGLNISLQGAVTGAQTTYGAYLSNTHTGASAVNVGLYATASGATGANYAAIFDQGNVGIGTTSPAKQLQIGTGLQIYQDSGTAGRIVGMSGQQLQLWGAPSGSGIYIYGQDPGTSQGALIVSNNSGEQLLTFNSSGGSLVGQIGADGGTNGMQVNSSRFGALTLAGGNGDSAGSATDVAGTNILLNGGRPTGAGSGGQIIFSTATAGSTGTTLRSLVEAMRVNSTQEVQIGSATDLGAYKLQVTGDSYHAGSVVAVKTFTSSPGSGGLIDSSMTLSGSGIDFVSASAVKANLTMTGNNTFVSSAYGSALIGQFSIVSGADYTYTAGHQLAAILARPYVDGAGSTADWITGIRVQPQFYNSAAVTSYTGILLQAPDLSGGGTLTNKAGIYSEAGVGNSTFMDELQIGSATDLGAYKLQVTGDSDFVGNITQTSTNTTQTTTSSIFALNGNSLTSGTGLYAASSTLSSGSLIDLSITGTAAASNTQKVLNISTSGANATSTQTTYGGYFSNTHTGSSSKNIGLYVTASGGSTNYAAIFESGQVGIGTNAPNATLTIGAAQPTTNASGNGTAAIPLLNTLSSTGKGGDSSYSTGSVVGGIGAAFTLVGGTGGSITGTPTNGFGGAGGNFSLTSGTGGGGGGTNAYGGSGGNFSISAGSGGFGSTAGGGGGYLEMKAGNAGSLGNIDGGNVYIVGGSKNSSGIDGNVILGVTQSGTVRGNVGIGTTTPDEIFNITGSRKAMRIGYAATFGETSQGSSAMLVLGRNVRPTGTNDDLEYVQTNGAIGGQAITMNNGVIQFNVTTGSVTAGGAFSGTEKMRIDSSGNLGIGDTSPAAMLTVGSGDLFQVNSSGNATLNSVNTTQTTTSSILSMNANSLTTGTGLYATSSTLTTGNLFDLQISSTASASNQVALNILTTGSISTAATTYGIKVSNTHSSGASDPANIGIYANASGGTYNYAGIFDAGSVGIGDTTPDYKLDVADTGIDGNIFSLTDSDGECLYNPEAGGVTVSCSSDERLKKDIVDAPSALSYFKSFRVRQYNVRASGDSMIGVIAQEVLQTNPELVTMGSNGMYSVQLPSQWQVVEAIQELDIKVQGFSSLDTTVDNSIGYLIKNFLADVSNTIEDLYASVIHSNKIETKELCVGSTCITEDQFLRMVQQSGGQNSGGGSNGDNPPPTETPPVDQPSEDNPPKNTPTPTDPPTSDTPPPTDNPPTQ